MSVRIYQTVRRHSFRKCPYLLQQHTVSRQTIIPKLCDVWVLQDFRASFGAVFLVLSRRFCSALVRSGQVRSGLVSARNKPVVGRYLFRSVFPFTLILLCPLGATQSRPAMSVQAACVQVPFRWTYIRWRHSVTSWSAVVACHFSAHFSFVKSRMLMRLCVPHCQMVRVCAPLSDCACVCPTVRWCVYVPTVRLCVCVPHCQIVRVCAPLSDLKQFDTFL